MRPILRTLIALACAVLLNGCLYINATYPLDQDMNETKVTEKIGKSARYSLLWAVAWGDGGTQAAARNGGLTVIHNADTHDEVSFFGLWSKRTTIVYGE